MTKPSIIGITCLAGMLILSRGVQAEEFPGIERLMGSEKFKAAGLERLSDEELNSLNQWLISYTAGEAEILKAGNEEVREAVKSFEVLARIKGEFEGWDGESIFRLDNGQIWRQRIQGNYFYHGPASPEVRISRNWMGFYKLTVVETGKSVGVSLVK